MYEQVFCPTLVSVDAEKNVAGQLHCPHHECEQHPLTSAGVYPRERQVLDIDYLYILAAEYLECLKCGRKLISWSPAIIKQLDVGHQMQFPVLMTHKYACDIRVGKQLLPTFLQVRRTTRGGVADQMCPVPVGLAMLYQGQRSGDDYLSKPRGPTSENPRPKTQLAVDELLPGCAVSNRRGQG